MKLSTTLDLVNLATPIATATVGWLVGGMDGAILALCTVAVAVILRIDDNTRGRP